MAGQRTIISCHTQAAKKWVNMVSESADQVASSPRRGENIRAQFKFGGNQPKLQKIGFCEVISAIPTKIW